VIGSQIAILGGGLGLAFVALTVAPLIVALKLDLRDRNAWRSASSTMSKT
jgi:hypothetical protein